MFDDKTPDALPEPCHFSRQPATFRVPAIASLCGSMTYLICGNPVSQRTNVAVIG
jgi:hypothetical protein